MIKNERHLKILIIQSSYQQYWNAKTTRWIVPFISNAFIQLRNYLEILKYFQYFLADAGNIQKLLECLEGSKKEKRSSYQNLKNELKNFIKSNVYFSRSISDSDYQKINMFCHIDPYTITAGYEESTDEKSALKGFYADTKYKLDEILSLSFLDALNNHLDILKDCDKLFKNKETFKYSILDYVNEILSEIQKNQTLRPDLKSKE